MSGSLVTALTETRRAGSLEAGVRSEAREPGGARPPELGSAAPTTAMMWMKFRPSTGKPSQSASNHYVRTARPLPDVIECLQRGNGPLLEGVFRRWAARVMRPGAWPAHAAS